jgi:type IV secretory pathway protease TraF
VLVGGGYVSRANSVRVWALLVPDRGSGLSDAQGEPLPRVAVVRWLAEQEVFLATCQSDCGRTYRLSAFTTVEG